MNSKADNDNVFLIGLMGAGKSTIGKQLASRLGKEFRDSDHEIENKTGVAIDVIFDIEGEAGFRQREAQVLRELAALRGIVLATGGGAVLVPENRQLLKDNGLVVYLEASAEHLAERLRPDRRRPLLQSGDKLAKLRALLARRDPVYRQLADLVVATSDRSAHRIVNEIRARLQPA